MASAASDASLNASTGRKRTLPSDIRDSARPSPQKAKETKIDRQRKARAERLKGKIELELEFVKGKDVADEPMLRFYCSFCDDILANTADDQLVLTFFKTAFASQVDFKGKDVLLK